MLDATAAAAHFLGSLAQAREEQTPYRHWLLENMLPGAMVRDIIALPVAPPVVEDTLGRRETHNSTRWFFSVEQQKQFPVCRELAEALQSHEVVETLERTCAVNLKGSSLRIEYCLDTDGFWLEPHTDIGAKFFTMLIYLTELRAGRELGHGHLRLPRRACRRSTLHPQSWADLHPRRRYLARLRQAQDHRGPALTDRELRDRGMARPARAGLPRNASGVTRHTRAMVFSAITSGGGCSPISVSWKRR